jgi:hypothetical protein
MKWLKPRLFLRNLGIFFAGNRLKRTAPLKRAPWAYKCMFFNLNIWLPLACLGAEYRRASVSRRQRVTNWVPAPARGNPRKHRATLSDSLKTAIESYNRQQGAARDIAMGRLRHTIRVVLGEAKRLVQQIEHVKAHTRDRG